MKKIFTLIVLFAVAFSGAHSQVVLNEIYTSPNAGKHEFFELYNSSTLSTPQSVDGFSIVTYFEEGSTKGFYVLDLPALFINPHSFFVGAAAMPFSFQGTVNSTKADFSWNSPTLATNSGYLKKWVMTGSDGSDGNVSYNEAAVPANFNDLFYEKSNGTVNYSIFVFKNGILVNSLYGGVGGATVQPSFITSMPSLNVNSLVGSTNVPFTISFNSLANNLAEYVIPSPGTDNGYIRTSDGVCGTWKKSSSTSTHTPGVTNGSSGAGSVVVTASITRGVFPATTSTVTFDVTEAAAAAFPVELQVYVDNGSVPGDLDAFDTYLSSVTQTLLSDPASTLSFSPASANIMIVAKTAAGCFGQEKYVTDGTNSTLPIKLVSFNGNLKDGKVALAWKVELNETADKFEVERSVDGGKFTYVGTVMGTLNPGTASYSFTDAVPSNEKIAYRLKMIDNNQVAEFSKIISFYSGSNGGNVISLLQNPVYDKISIGFQTIQNENVDIRVIDMTGSVKARQRMSAQPGSNVLNVQLPSTLATGTYIVSVVHSKGMFNQKLLKN
jgi:hypothetical protein